jgi:hypothetical protein
MKTKLNKTQERIIADLEIGANSEVVENPWSGERVLLEPKAVALYDFIKGCESLGKYGKDFDQARYAFAALWPDAYMQLLD